ncbi:methyl-accepting chemotaxis protein [Psychrobacillus glaciei]|uniref:methyl-accepting chemotaxis protein n=1 Tax=Psychrobacillus glaciei TaxID=2283160 RepID=UPI00124E13AC|nr:HAMP domain-containing methyl-accepting chemotaxis protein [Psychrobacillus glaciei]
MAKLRNVRIARKLFTLIFSSIFIFVLIGGTGFYFMGQMSKDSTAMYEDAVLPIKWQAQIRINNRAVDGLALEMLLTSNKNTRSELNEEIKGYINDNEELVVKLENSDLDKKEKKKITQYKEQNEKYVSELNKIVNFAMNGNATVGNTRYQKDVKPIREKLNVIMKELGNDLENNAEALNNNTLKSDTTSKIIILVVFIISLVFSVGLGIVIVRMIVNPLKIIQDLMVQAENGDLTVVGKYHSNDEIGVLTSSFNSMMSRLRELMRLVNGTSEQVAASSEELTASAEESTKASEEVASTIQEVASGAELQVKSTLESTKIVEEMASSIHQIATNAKDISTNALETSRKASDGNEAIQSTIEQMSSINVTVSELSHVVKGLGDRSQDIGNIVEEITSIATQTNLLALNAAIESARAGEYGKGFSVVADEVRKLAEQSAKSAQSISDLIALIQTETKIAVQSMEKTTSEVAGGIEVVHKAGKSFEQIRTSVDDVANQLQDVSAAAQHLSIGSDQVLQAEKLLAEIADEAASGTQNVAASIEEQLASMQEISASAESLANMANSLQEQISRFKV